MRGEDSDEITLFDSWRPEDMKPIMCRNDMRTVKSIIGFYELNQTVPIRRHELVNPTRGIGDEEICGEILTQQDDRSTIVKEFLELLSVDEGHIR